MPMRLRNCQIINREVPVPTRRRYVRKKNPRNTNTNEERHHDSTGRGMVATTSSGENASIISMMVTPSILQDGAIIPLSITSSILISRGVEKPMASDFRPYDPSLTLPMFG